MNLAEAEVIDVRIAEDAIKERITDEDEETATLMRRKRCRSYHYSDDKTCEPCLNCKIKEMYSSDVYCEVDNQVINLEDPACNNFEDK